MKIILTGFMGSGKSIIGKNLALKLDLPFIDMDKLVIEKSGRKNIKEIFQKDDEIGFRRLEIDVAEDLREIKNSVISTGGGIVLNSIILDYLKNKPEDLIVFLDTNFRSIFGRLKNDNSRPLFNSIEKAKKLFAIRKPLYKNYADIIIDTDNKPPNIIIKEIIRMINTL